MTALLASWSPLRACWTRAAASLLVVALAACGDDSTTAATGAGGGGGAGGSATVSTVDTTAASAGNGGAAPSFSIMAWNVQSFPKTSGAAAVVEATIGAETPVIAAFEEVDRVDLLEQALDATTDYDVVSENLSPFALVAAVDHARAEIINAGSIFADQTYLFPRAPLVARIGLLDGSGFQLDLVVVHQKALVDAESQQRRKDANDRLVSWCKSRFDATGDPIILVGDFNDQVTDPPADDVFASFKSADAPSYWFLTAPSESNGEFTYIPFKSFIDHQLATANLRDTFPTATVEVLPLEGQFESYVSRVSDHRPVRVDYVR